MLSSNNKMKQETISVSSDYHQIFIEDPEAEMTDMEYPGSDMVNRGYCIFGNTLAISVENYGDIKVTFQNYEPEGRFLYRGKVDFYTKSKTICLTGPVADLKDNIVEVAETKVLFLIYTNREDCASEVVLVTDIEFKIISTEDPPEYFYSIPEDWEEDGYFGTKIILDNWDGIDLPTAIDHPCEGSILAGDSAYVKNTGCQNIDDDLIFYHPAYSENVGVRMHLLGKNNPLTESFIDTEKLILLEKRFLTCPSETFIVSDFLGYRPYFTFPLKSENCELSVYINHDYDDSDGYNHTFLFVVGG